MKRIALSFAALFCLASPLSTAACESPDWRICGARGGCAKGCSDRPGDNPVSLEVAGVTAAELGRMLSDFSEKRITLGVSNPNELFSLEVKNMPLEKLLDELAVHGAVVESAASKAERVAGLPDANVTIKLARVTASELVEMFEVLLSGSGFVLEPSDPGLLLSLDVKNMPLRDLIPLLASTASVRLRSV